MRLLITTDTVGGVWTYTCELVSGLLQEGVSVLLMTLGRNLSASQSAWATAMRRKYPDNFMLVPTSYKLEWMENADADVAASREYLISLVSKWEPDLLHTNQFCFASLDLAFPKVLVAHSDVVSWWQAVHGVSPPHSVWLDTYRNIARQGVQQATCVIAPTQWMLDQIHTNFGAPLHSRVIANGCSLPTVSSGQPRQLRAVSVGRLWDEGKNIAILRDLNADMPIAVAGEWCSPDSGVHPHRTAASRPDGVEYLGILDRKQINALMQTSAIYVATSRYEPFGLAPVEAALAGCAIVANDIPPLREVWGDAAIYYTRNDPDSLRATLSHLASNPDLLGHHAHLANHRARSRYLASKMISAYLHLYRVLFSAASLAYA
jgi:glycogen(starch) synthase